MLLNLAENIIRHQTKLVPAFPSLVS